MKIINVKAREIFDSRSNPTVEVDVFLESGVIGRFAVPSGASVGEREALELRDGDERLFGKGVSKAVSNVNDVIRKEIVGRDFASLEELDNFLIGLDKTSNKSNLGANAILGVSGAFLRASSLEKKVPLHTYLSSSSVLPIPMMNVLNGGKHADNNIDFQEFMIVPVSNTIRGRLEIGVTVFQSLKKLLKDNNLSTAVGDEGGFAPNLESNIQVLDFLMEAIKLAGYVPGRDVNLALDVAASELYRDGFYYFDGKKYDKGELVEYYQNLIEKYPIISIEDPTDQNDWETFHTLTELFGDKILLVGDDLFVTNPECLKFGIQNQSGNAILIKPNQIGTITETANTIKLAKGHGYKTIMSHRSGETEDTSIADLAVGFATDYIKTGSLSRSDRVAKYNQLLRIEEGIQQNQS